MAIRFWEIYKEAKEKYKLRLLAGKNGMDNVISWVHMLEDETIISRFSGEELAVTTGMKSEEDGWLLHLVMAMKQAECTGIIVNTGMYLKHIPQEVISWCEDHDFPLLETPWEISITELTQEYCMRIMQKMRKEKQYGIMFERMLRGKEVPAEFLEEISLRYNLDGSFQIFCMKPAYTPEEKILFHKAALKLENVFGLWQNGMKIRFPYFLTDMNESCILVVNDFPENSIPELTSQIESFFSYFFDKEQLFVGIGPVCHGIQNLKHAMNRAKIAMNMALTMKKPIVNFNEMGVYAVLFSSNDLEILTNYANTLLKPLDDYDRLHHSGGNSSLGYVETLRSYIKYDRSLIAASQATYTHRNTFHYRIQNIKKLLGNDLKTVTDLFPYQLAFCIRDMKLS